MTPSEKALVKQIITQVKQNTPQFFFDNHVEIVGERAKAWAIRFGADPVVCTLAGYLHDIGYTRKPASDRRTHIENGMVIAKRWLTSKTSEAVVDKVVSCIDTHDGYLKENSPIENQVVSDVDATVFLETALTMYPYVHIFSKKSPKEMIEFMKEHATVSWNILSIPEIKQEYAPIHKALKKSLIQLSTLAKKLE